MARAPYENLLLPFTGAAAADLSAKVGYACSISGTSVALATAKGRGDGIIVSVASSAVGASVCVLRHGIHPVKIAGTVTAGDELGVGTGGALVKAYGRQVVAVALDSGVSADEITAFICPQADKPVRWETWYMNTLALISVDGDKVTGIVPGYNGSIVGLRAVATVAASTADKTCVVNAEIGTTDVTGGVLTMTTAGLNAIGKVQTSTAVTGADEFGPTDAISIEVASSTQFSEGSGYIQIGLK